MCTHRFIGVHTRTRVQIHTTCVHRYGYIDSCNRQASTHVYTHVTVHTKVCKVCTRRVHTRDTPGSPSVQLCFRCQRRCFCLWVLTARPQSRGRGRTPWRPGFECEPPPWALLSVSVAWGCWHFGHRLQEGLSVLARARAGAGPCSGATWCLCSGTQVWGAGLLKQGTLFGAGGSWAGRRHFPEWALCSAPREPPPRSPP